MRTSIFLSVFVFALLIACNQPAEPVATDPPAVSQSEGQPIAESGEVLGAAPVTQAAITVYCSWNLVTGYGATQKTGARFVQSSAWTMPTAGQVEDKGAFLKDLIRALTSDGTLSGVDLNKAGVELTVIYPGASPRRDWILKSSGLPRAASPK